MRFRELFLGQHPTFPAPLVGFGAGGYYSYVPLSFAKSCVVRMRAPKMQFYQINYALYPPETPVRTFSLEPASNEISQRQKVCQIWSSPGQDLAPLTAPPGAVLQSVRHSIVLAPHSAATLFQAERGGRIVGLRLSPASALASKARDLLLKISFDGDAPAVMCPAGDFFGYAWGQPAMQSLLAGTVGPTNYSYWPMPFDRNAKVEMVSEKDSSIQFDVEVVWAAVPRAQDEGKFYALWRRENPTTPGEPYTFIQTEGRGHLVGVVLQAQGIESGKTLFFEGDDETTIDGESVVHGTGSEDFFNGGWYDVPDRWEKRICFPLSGCLDYSKHLGRTGGYRLFVGDAYAYRKSIRQTIEHSGEKNNIPTDYCSVSCFYSEFPPTCNLTPPPLAQRAVQDPGQIIFPAWWQLPIHAWSFEQASLTRKKAMLGGQEVRFLSLQATNQDWFGPHFMSPVCDVPAAGNYRIYIEAVKGPTQGQLQLFQNENPVSAPVDLYAEKPAKSGRLLLGQIPMAEGKNSLMFKLVGRNERSSGLGLDLVTVICVRE